MKNLLFIIAIATFSIFDSYAQFGRAYQSFQIESSEESEARLNRNNYRDGERSYFEVELHECANNGYHNTGYESHCFDMYFSSNGSGYWDRRRFGKYFYNDELSGSYYLVSVGYNRYNLYIRWNNGKCKDGYVDYDGNGRARIHFDGYVFTSK